MQSLTKNKRKHRDWIITLPVNEKYKVTNYNVNAENIAPFIKKYLNISSVQTKGNGASSSLKLVPASLSGISATKSTSGKQKKSTARGEAKKLHAKTYQIVDSC